MLVDARSAEIASVPLTIQIPAGTFIRGSDRAEREHAYQLDEAAYGHSVTRKNRWYESEFKRAPVTTNAFAITKTLVTNKQYASFVAATGHRVPDVDRATWKSYGLIHPFSRTLRHAWSEGQPPKGREKHPVVLVSHPDAKAYATWLSEATGDVWRLSTENRMGESRARLKGAAISLGRDVRSVAVEQSRQGTLRYRARRYLSRGREPVWHAGLCRPGVRMDRHAGLRATPIHRKRRILGR